MSLSYPLPGEHYLSERRLKTFRSIYSSKCDVQFISPSFAKEMFSAEGWQLYVCNRICLNSLSKIQFGIFSYIVELIWFYSYPPPINTQYCFHATVCIPRINLNDDVSSNQKRKYLFHKTMTANAHNALQSAAIYTTTDCCSCAALLLLQRIILVDAAEKMDHPTSNEVNPLHRALAIKEV